MERGLRKKIPIGKVSLVEQDPEKEFSLVEIEPFENLENLTDLILIWDYKPTKFTNEKSNNNIESTQKIDE